MSDSTIYQVGVYRGVKWMRLPLREIMPHLAASVPWYKITLTGDHFRTFAELAAHVDRLKGADR